MGEEIWGEGEQETIKSLRYSTKTLEDPFFPGSPDLPKTIDSPKEEEDLELKIKTKPTPPLAKPSPLAKETPKPKGDTPTVKPEIKLPKKASGTPTKIEKTKPIEALPEAYIPGLPMDDPEDIKTAVEEFINAYGDNAAAMARERQRKLGWGDVQRDFWDEVIKTIKEKGVEDKEYTPTKFEQTSEQDIKQRQNISKSLSTSKIKEAKLIGGGLNAPQIVKLKNGMAGVLKEGSKELVHDDVYGRRGPRSGIPPQEGFIREVAASVIAEVLGFADLVPPTSFRGEGASIQEYVEGLTPFEVSNPFTSDEDAARAAIFDYLTANSDRHTGNWLLRSKGGKIVIIDNGSSFPYKYDKSDYFDFAFMWNAIGKDLDMPDLSYWEGKWDQVEQALRKVKVKDLKLSDETIALTKTRFEYLVNAKSNSITKIANLPSFLAEYHTLRDMVERLGSAQRNL